MSFKFLVRAFVFWSAALAFAAVASCFVWTWELLPSSIVTAAIVIAYGRNRE